MDSDISSRSVDKKIRLGDLRLASVTDTGAAREHAQSWRSDIEDKVDTQTRMDPGASFGLDGGGPVLSAWFAGDCSRFSGRELTQSEECVRADLARKAKVGELGAWGHFRCV